MHAHGGAREVQEKVKYQIPIAISFTEQEVLDVHGTSWDTLTWAFKCLRILGRDEEIPAEYRTWPGLESADLRFSQHRDRVYELLPFDKSIYFEQQEQVGHDIGRFFRS